MADAQRNLELQLLRTAKSDKDSMRTVVNNLGDYQFTDPFLEWIWDRFKDCWGKGETANPKTLHGFARTEPVDVQETIVDAIIEVWNADPSQSPITDCEILRRYQRHDKMAKGMDRAVKAMGRGDLDTAQATLAKVSTEASDTAHLKVSSLIDFDDWNSPIEGSQGIPTGIRTFDEVTLGGPNRGDLGLIFGSTGMGKSILATNIGHMAYKLNRRVLHIDSENGLATVRSRWMARITRRPANTIRRRRHTYSDDMNLWIQRHKERIDKLLKIIHTGVEQTTVDEVEAQVNQLIQEGWKPDIVLWDSLDHTVMKMSSDNFSLMNKQRYERVTGLAQKWDAVIWAVTQAKADAEGRIATNKHVAWGYDKARIAAFVLTINPGLDEHGDVLPEKKMDGQRSIFVSKARHAPGRFNIDLQTDFPTSYMTESTPGDDPLDDDEI